MSDSTYLAPPLHEPDAWAEVTTPTAIEFGAVEEPGADALLGTADQNLLPVGGDAMMYGDGGSGKTTLAVDLACHLATGIPWLDIPINQPVNVLLIENEGPRPLFRRKINRKLAGWEGPDPGERLRVWEDPWSAFAFSNHEMQAQLARTVFELELDLVIAGPLTQLGMLDAGTLAEVRAFAKLIADVRNSSQRPVAFLLVHHESKGGRVSGAWEGAGDTMLHVQGIAHGHTRVYIQKARWGSDYHAKTLKLTWQEGESFIIDDSDATRPERAWDDIEAFVRQHPGCTWNAVKTGVTGEATYLAGRRDQMLSAGVLIDVGKGSRYELWHRDDPAAPQRFDTEESGSEPVRNAEPISGSEHRTTSEPPDSPPRSGSIGEGGSAVRYVSSEPPSPNRSAAPSDPSDDGEDW